MNTEYFETQIALQSLLESGLVPKWREDFVRGISMARTPTPNQLQWCQKILDEILADSASVSALNNTYADRFQRIFNLFTEANKHLKYPKVRLTMKDGSEIKLQPASMHAKHPGDISIVVAGVYLGRIDKNDHSIIFTRDAKGKEQTVLDFLIALNGDPVKFASEYGKLNTRCCFCHMTLKTIESLAVGYGPDCASHYGLPWGIKKFVAKEDMEWTAV